MFEAKLTSIASKKAVVTLLLSTLFRLTSVLCILRRGQKPATP
jgi:hypothetical protein